MPIILKRNKYGAVKTVIDGITFDSKREAKRYSDLKLLQAAGEIRDLELQPSYDIKINSNHICRVILDFRYLRIKDRSGWIHETIIEDSKGRDTPISKLKRKLVEAAYGIQVTLV